MLLKLPIHHIIKTTKKTMKPKAKLRFIAPEADENETANKENANLEHRI